MNILKHQLKQYLQNNLKHGENTRARNHGRYPRALYTQDRHLATTRTFATPDPSKIWGVDVSGRWDGNVQFIITKSMGAHFAIIKCMDGTVPTRLWLENRQRSISAGLVTGEYCWLYPHKFVDCKAQAQAVWNKIKDQPKQLPLTVDFEWTNYAGAPANPNYTDLDIFVTEFIRLAGYKPMLYSAGGYMSKFGRIPDLLKNKFSALWIANYGVTSPMLPTGYTGWDIWQFAATGDATLLAPNDSGKLEVDLDYWRGDLQSLRVFAGLAGVDPDPTPIPDEEPMTLYGRNETELTNIRSGPGTGYADIGDLRLNDLVEADRKDASGVWWHLTKITRANGDNFPLPAADCWAYGNNIEELAPPAPAVAGRIQITIHAQFTDAAGNTIAEKTVMVDEPLEAV